MNEKGNDYVTDEVCTERQKNAADKFGRDKERLDKIEVTNEDLKQITVRLDVVIEQQKEQLSNLDKRVGILESRPSKIWDRIVFALIGAFATGVAGAIIGLIIH